MSKRCALLLCVAVLADATHAVAVPPLKPEGLESRGLEQEEENMRVISRNELAHRSARELAALYAWVSDEVFRTRYLSPEWQAAALHKSGCIIAWTIEP